MTARPSPARTACSRKDTAMPTTAKSSTTDKVRALHDRLTAEVEALVTGEDWARFLSVAARFHSYSTGAGRYSNPPNACPLTSSAG